MKKKAVGTALFTLALSAIMCLGFAACGEEKTEDDVGGDKGDQELASEKVTEAEWNAAFEKDNFANVKVELSSHMEAHWGDDGVKYFYDVPEEETITIADGKYHVTWNSQFITKVNNVEDGREQEVGDEYIKKDADGTYLIYKQEKEKWAVSLKNSYQLHCINSGMIDLHKKFDYSEFEYSDEAKGYVSIFTSDDPQIPAEMKTSLKFKGGKIASYQVDCTSDGAFGIYNPGGDSGESLVIKADCIYDSQSVTLPNVEIEPYGTYNFYSMTVIEGSKETTIKVGDKLGGVDIPADMMSMTLNKDGTVVYVVRDFDDTGTVGGVTSTGTFTVSDKSIIVTIDGKTTTYIWDGVYTITTSSKNGDQTGTTVFKKAID